MKGDRIVAATYTYT